MNLWTIKRYIAVFFVLWTSSLLCACSADMDMAGDFDDYGGLMWDEEDLGPGRDAEPETGQQQCSLWTPEGCFETQADICDLFDELGDSCTDEDGDCFPIACNDEEAKAFFANIMDCNDGNPDVHPAQMEWCDGRDDDCDAEVDEDFALGIDCEGCIPMTEETESMCGLCGQGRMECSVTDPRTTACSTAPGQSEAADPASEACDGLDNDCDADIDEGCSIPSTVGAPILDAFWCREELLTLTAEGLHRGTPISPKDTTYPLETEIRSPFCWGDSLYWLALEEPCIPGESGPRACLSLVYRAEGEGPVLGLRGTRLMGDPVVKDNLLFFHELVSTDIEGARPRLSVYDFMSANAPAFEFDDMSDPVPLDQGLLVRRWEETNAGQLRPRVELRFLDNEDTSGLVQSPLGFSGIPQASSEWTAWPIGQDRSAVWAVPMDDLSRGGFQLPLPEGRYDVLAVMAGYIFIHDLSSASNTLLVFDLNMGQSRVFLEHVIPGSFRISDSGEQALWRVEETDGEVLRVEQNFLSSLGD